jgi:BolA protein
MSIAARIRAKLTEAFSPALFELLDESAHHAGHAGMQGLAAQETHFRLTLVTEAFRGMPRVQRQREIYRLLAEEFADGMHALAVTAKAPGE